MLGRRISVLGRVVGTEKRGMMDIDEIVEEKKKQWYLATDQSSKKEYFLHVSRKGPSLVVRAWDARSGIFMSKLVGKDAEDMVATLKDRGRALFLDKSPNVARDCHVRLPQDVLEALGRSLAYERRRAA
jgi:hypothetical protein